MYEADLSWTAERILAATIENGVRLFLVRWADHDHTHDTWEPRQSILDKVLLRDFRRGMEATVDIEHALYSLRKVTRSALRHKLGAELGITVDVPAASECRNVTARSNATNR